MDLSIFLYSHWSEVESLAHPQAMFIYIDYPTSLASVLASSSK